MNPKKVKEALQYYQKMGTDSEKFNIGICHICLGNYPEAKASLEESIMIMIENPRLWFLMEMPSLLIDIWVLSGREELYDEIYQHVVLFREAKGDELFLVNYAYTLLNLLTFSSLKKSTNVDKLLSRPKYVYYHSTGLALKAIIEKDKMSFRQSMDVLLKTHDGMAKHGMLRETPRGFFSLPAMSLAYAALKHGMKVDLNSEYVPMDYLYYIYPELLARWNGNRADPSIDTWAPKE